MKTSNLSTIRYYTSLSKKSKTSKLNLSSQSRICMLKSGFDNGLLRLGATIKVGEQKKESWAE